MQTTTVAIEITIAITIEIEEFTIIFGNVRHQNPNEWNNFFKQNVFNKKLNIGNTN